MFIIIGCGQRIFRRTLKTTSISDLTYFRKSILKSPSVVTTRKWSTVEPSEHNIGRLKSFIASSGKIRNHFGYRDRPISTRDLEKIISGSRSCKYCHRSIASLLRPKHLYISPEDDGDTSEVELQKDASQVSAVKQEEDAMLEIIKALRFEQALNEHVQGKQDVESVMPMMDNDAAPVVLHPPNGAVPASEYSVDDFYVLMPEGSLPIQHPVSQSLAINQDSIEPQRVTAVHYETLFADIIGTELQKRGPCTYHPDPILPDQDYHTCCNEPPRSQGCQTKPMHVPNELVSQLTNKQKASIVRLRRHHTPSSMELSRPDKRIAVVLDCEMGATADCETMLIKLCMVDYFTGEVLIDSLVKPDVAVQEYHTKWSGVRKSDMAFAIANGTFLDGTAHARKTIWKYVDTDTIVIAHGGSNDLSALNWIHYNIVDTLIIAALDPKGHRRKDLKYLCKTLLGISIQNREHLGHDCLEDTLACRELAIHLTLKSANVEGKKTERRRVRLADHEPFDHTIETENLSRSIAIDPTNESLPISEYGTNDAAL